MELTNIKGLSKCSHKQIHIECDFKISHKCRDKYYKEYREFKKVRAKNNGKDICIFCSRELKYTGRNNPNCKYDFDDNLFNNIDDEFKAYILGFIAADGSIDNKNNKCVIEIHKKDIDILESIKSYICKDLNIYFRKNRETCSLTISSKQICKDLKRHLDLIEDYNKCEDFSVPLLDRELRYHFIRGYFDGDGHIKYPKATKYPTCGITTSSEKFINFMEENIIIPFSIYRDRGTVFKISFSSNNCLDFLHILYDKCNISMNRKYDMYVLWKNWVPSFVGRLPKNNVSFKWSKSDKNAFPPKKSRASDSGYDLTLIKEIKRVGKTIFYDTGIKVLPDYGWYFDLVSRSSLSKTGYILANSIGIIDRTYTGNIIVALIKIDENAKDLELPFRAVQIIPRPIVHFDDIEVEEHMLDITERSDKGFGSSGK